MNVSYSRRHSKLICLLFGRNGNFLHILMFFSGKRMWNHAHVIVHCAASHVYTCRIFCTNIYVGPMSLKIIVCVLEFEKRLWMINDRRHKDIKGRWWWKFQLINWMCERLKLNGLIEPTYRSDCVRFSELVDGSIKAGHSNDERPICKIYEKSRRTPYRPRELHTSRRQGGEEVSQVETIVRGYIRLKLLWGDISGWILNLESGLASPGTLLPTHAT